MTIAGVILFAFGAVGMSHIIVDGKIFQGVRDLADRILPSFLCEVLKCYQCSGFWCGLVCGYLILAMNLPVWWEIVATTFVSGCAGSFLSAWAAVYMNVLEAQWFNTEIQKEDQ